MAKRKEIIIEDPVGDYAKAVLAGSIVAGPHVRAACARHIDDLKNGKKRGLRFDYDLAERAIGFFRDELCLNGGLYEGEPFELNDWECFVVGSLFGWLGSDGYRRFRVAYIETGKGSGKSPLVAGIGLYGLVADGESRAEIYAAATKKDQAMVLFRDAVAMVDQSEGLNQVIGRSGVGLGVWNLTFMKTASFFRPISADDGQSGPRPHIALLDEIHEHKTANVVEMMRAGTKNRRQALILMITNSGFNKQTVCWHYHDYGTKIVSQQLVDDSFFAYICALDEGEDPLKDESCWIKANPSLRPERKVKLADGTTVIDSGIPGLKYIREQVTQARGMPAKESIVRRLNFCQWVGAENPWITADVWFGCQDDFDESMLIGRRCFGGLDLSSVRDLTSFVLVFEPTAEDPKWRLLSWFWLPDDNLQEKSDNDHVPYIAMRDAGHLLTTPGKVINKLAVAIHCAKMKEKFDVVEIGYDRWLIEEFKAMCSDNGIELPLVPFGQGFKDMAPAINEFERMIVGQNIAHNGNPVMTMCAANAVVIADPAGNRKITKEKATGRVDGIVAGVMAVGTAFMEREEVMQPGIEVW